MNAEGFPGRRVATRIRAAATSPFASSEPHPIRTWPIVPVAGRLPARHRDFCDSGTGLRLAAPTSTSADHAACGSSVDGGTLRRRHESRTRISVSTILTAADPEADFAARHYPFRANPHPFAGRVVTGGMRGEPTRALVGATTRVAHRAGAGRGLRRGPR